MKNKITLDIFLHTEKQNCRAENKNSEISQNISGVSVRDIEIIFCEILELSDVDLITKTQKILTENEIREISEKISARKSGKSLSEIFQKKMFFGTEFFVTNDVLTPRPETECIVEYSLSLFKRGSKTEEGTPEISGFLDIGTGSGCIITSIAKYIGKKIPEFLAGDISEKALVVARKNAEKILPHPQPLSPREREAEHTNTKNSIDFRQSDLLENFSDAEISGKIIVTNLPYIPQKDEEWMEREVLGGDPHVSLFSGETGLDLYQKFFTQLKTVSDTLKKSENSDFYAVIFEYDPPQTEFFQKFLSELFPERNIEFFKDLSGQVRFGVVK